jgi:hypothetical protein
MSRATALAYALLLLTLTLLFWPALTGQERLGFRDTSHFYTPLYQYVADRQEEDWVPLWNPFDMTGLPLAGETTTALFYPPRWLIYAIAPSAETAIAWYIVIHLIWSAISVHWASRLAGAKGIGCAVAILTYPLAGPIFFQIHNVPFLVGAAWLPLAISGMIRLIRRPHSCWIAITGISLAMPTLGGDPQTTAHAFLFVLPFGMWHTFGKGRASWHRTSPQVISVLVAILLSVLLSAPQLASSIDWARQTDRVLNGSASEGLAYNVPPWHWLELLVPTASGTLFPVYTRISHLIPSDGRTWVITLYAGVIPLLLFIHRYRNIYRNRNRKTRLTIWDALLPTGLLFSLSGPFWLVTELCPGYSSLRYPAKWLPFVSLGLAVIAAKQASWLFDRPQNALANTTALASLKKLCVFVATILLCVATCAVMASSIFIFQTAAETASVYDKYWGPLDVALAMKQIGWAAISSAIGCCAFWFTIRKSLRLNFILLLFMTAEMYLVSIPQVALVDRNEESKRLQQHPLPDHTRSMRITAGNPWPKRWSETRDPANRLQDVSASERNTRFGRWHLSEPTAVFNSTTSLRSQRIGSFWTAMNELGLKGIDSTNKDDWRKIDDWLGIDRRMTITAHDTNVSQLSITHSATSESLPSNLVRWDRNYRTIPPVRAMNTDQMVSRLEEVIGHKNVPPLVESNTSRSLAPATGGMNSAESPADRNVTDIKIISWQPETMRLRVSAEDEGLLTLKTSQDGNWIASLRSSSSDTDTDAVALPVERVDFLFMGCVVPAGEWTVAFHYAPWWLTPSMSASAIGCVGTVLALSLPFRSRLRSRRTRTLYIER